MLRNPFTTILPINYKRNPVSATVNVLESPHDHVKVGYFKIRNPCLDDALPEQLGRIQEELEGIVVFHNLAADPNWIPGTPQPRYITAVVVLENMYGSIYLEDTIIGLIENPYFNSEDAIPDDPTP